MFKFTSNLFVAIPSAHANCSSKFIEVLLKYFVLVALWSRTDGSAC